MAVIRRFMAVALVCGGCLLLYTSLSLDKIIGSDVTSSLLQHHDEDDHDVEHYRRHLRSHDACLGLEGREYRKCVRMIINDPKTVVAKRIVDDRYNTEPVENAAIRRENCQIVYILGVEGTTHHGITPIIETLAKQQCDPESRRTCRTYQVDDEAIYLKVGLFGWNKRILKKWGYSEGIIPDIDDPMFVQQVVERSCPNDGNKHVIIESSSFPSGQVDDPRLYRVHRQHEWLSMSPEDIANNDTAQQQPFNLTAFVGAYSPYVNIKFVVIHRPFIETIASHIKWDGGAVPHSNIIHGFLLILSRFLNTHRVDLVTGTPLWTLLCLEQIMAKNYEHVDDVEMARRNMILHLANFLGWPVKECKHCFDMWHESRKDPYVKLGDDLENVQQHANQLIGVWPPREEELIEQQCKI